jgi:hypothetical protein
VSHDSPGFLSSNVVQVPIDLDANIYGNSINVVGLLNPAFGNRCSNGEEGRDGMAISTPGRGRH